MLIFLIITYLFFAAFVPWVLWPTDMPRYMLVAIGLLWPATLIITGIAHRKGVILEAERKKDLQKNPPSEMDMVRDVMERLADATGGRVIVKEITHIPISRGDA